MATPESVNAYFSIISFSSPLTSFTLEVPFSFILGENEDF
jgi:hypothetical protein